ncbi:MAG: flagellar filament capping protein FliD, partial [Pirellulales bacterium]
NLNGGAGFGELGEITIQDRSGAVDTVDLSGALTVQDILSAINAAGVGVEARVNKDRDGIEIIDVTGATAANLQIANNDAANTADVLGIAVDAAVTSVASGSLNLQIVSENTLLANLSGGNGVSAGSILLTDTNGQKGSLNINSKIKTIGDVIEEIERLGLGIEARINDAGTGLLLVDTATGGGGLTVEAGAGSSAADLHLLSAVQEIDIEGTPTKVIDGSTITSIAIDADDSLTDLIERINEAGVGVSASLFNDGSGVKPYRLNLSSDTPGTRGELRVSTAGLSFTMEESIAAKDALLRTDSGQLVSSSTNSFSDVISGATLTVNAASETPVTVTVAASQSKLRQNVIAFVDTYNRIRGAIDELTAFDAETNKRGLLQGDGAMLRVENDLANLVSSRFFGAGVIQSVAELGITTSESGQLSFNQAAFDEKLAADPAAVKQFLSSANQGFADKFHAALERLTNVDNSVLVNRTEGLSRKIDNNAQRIDFLNARLERSRERLLLDFYNMELSIAKIQSNLSSIQSLAPLPPLTSTS